MECPLSELVLELLLTTLYLVLAAVCLNTVHVLVLIVLVCLAILFLIMLKDLFLW